MIPVLYPRDETEFTSNGLGRLPDCKTISVTEERNGVFELEMVYPITGAHYSDIALGCIVYTTFDHTRDPQPFEVYKRSAPIDGDVTFWAHHISYRLNDIVVTPFSINGTAAEAMSALKAHGVGNDPFVFTSSLDTALNYKITAPSTIRAMLAGTDGSILDVYGGEYRFDDFNVILTGARGADNGVSIRYGKNMIDITEEKDLAGNYNAVVPYWYSDEGGLVMLPEIFLLSDDVALADSAPWTADTAEEITGDTDEAFVFDYEVRTFQPLDMSSEFNEKPTVSELRDKARTKFSRTDAWKIDENITVSFTQIWDLSEYENVQALQRVGLCDTVTITHPTLGVSATAKVIKTVYDPIKEEYTSVELGKARSTFAETLTSRMTEEIMKQAASKDSMVYAIDKATQMINGGLGGYVVTTTNAEGQPQEILIMDTPDVNTASNVLRINRTGIGFSRTGYQGPFLSAWTIDGRFVADWITSGTLNAQVIRAGLLSDALGTNYWDLDTGEFRLADSTTVGGQTITQIAQSAQDAAEAAAAEALADAVLTINADISDLQSQIDGNIATWYYNYAPTLNNLPASDWTTTALKNDHLGDLFYDSTTGYAYRFVLDGTTYKWIRITDDDVSAALAAAQAAQDTADHKRRVFVATPTPPYDVGDLWVQGSNGDIKRCATAKTSSQSYAAADWVLASKYTDDSAVNALNASFTQAEIFNRLTGGGTIQGIFMENGQLYVNATYIKTGTLSADVIGAGTITANKLNVSTLSSIKADLGQVTAGDLRSFDYDYTGGAYSNEGMDISLNNKWIITPKFSVINGIMRATDGIFSGSVTATSGSIAGSLITSGISATNITTGTLSASRIAANSIAVSKLTGSITNGAWKIDLDTGSLTIGNISANNVKTGTLSAQNGDTSWNLNTGVFVTTDGTRTTRVTAGRIRFFSGGDETGRISPVGSSDEYGEGVAFAAGENAVYLGIGHRYTTSGGGVGYMSDFILNCGLNPGGRDQRFHFLGTSYFSGAMTLASTLTMNGNTITLGANQSYPATISRQTNGYTQISNGLTVGSGAAFSGYEFRVHGSAYINSTLSAYSVIQRSDENQKDIIPWDDKLDELIDRIEPIFFRWKDSEDKRLHIGVGARKTESILEELGLTDTGIVTVDAAGYAVNYIELSMILLHKYQQVKTRLEALEAKRTRRRKTE
jgi:phage-related protein